MVGTREQKNKSSDTFVPIKSHHIEPISGHNSCGGCNACHQMTGIHSMAGSPIFGGSDDGVQGASIQKPCAANFFQRKLGNSYMQSIGGGQVAPRNDVPTIQKKSSCGGSCTGCSGEEELQGIQNKLTIGSPNDVYEQEADRMAEQVMRMPEPQGSGVSGQGSAAVKIDKPVQAKPIGEEITPLVQRQIEEEEEEEEPIQAKQISGQTLQVGSKVKDQINAQRSSGKPLNPTTRAFMEPRFGFDFSHVQLHTDRHTHEAASQIKAKAFTYGNHVWLGKGENEQNKNLMAHELTHVVQQHDKKSHSPEIQRTVVVNPNTTAADDILGQFRFLCADVNFSRAGRTITGDSSSVASQSCECISDVVVDPDRTYTINVDTVSNNPRSVTLHDGTTVTIPSPSSGPRTDGGTDPTIHMPASAGSAIEFGAFSPTGTASWAPNWRILAHELCGHARLNQSYAGSKGNRPGHDATINTENVIASEHVGSARGEFANPRQGESFHNPVGNQSMVAFMLQNGWHYEAP